MGKGKDEGDNFSLSFDGQDIQTTFFVTCQSDKGKVRAQQVNQTAVERNPKVC